MNATDRILERLYDRGEGFFSLSELSAAARLPGPERLEGALRALGDGGYALEFSPGHGVRLIRPVKLNARLIERELDTRRVGRSVICFDEVDSTNDLAFDSARRPNADGLVVLAESQRRGRGRRGRRWLSSPGAGVLMSVLLLDEHEKLPHEALTIAAGLAVAEGVEAACALAPQVKWPNDVLIDDAKLAGVLVEIRRVSQRRAVVVGIGLNVDATPPAGEVDRPAACLRDHLGYSPERNEIVRHILRRLDDWTGRILAGRWENLHSAWLARCGMLNRRVSVLCAGRRYDGRVLDIRPLEGLILRCDDGRDVRLPADGATIVG